MRPIAFLPAALAALLLSAGSAGATAIHGQFVGTDFTFGTFGVSGQLVQETSNAGDPEPLFGAPVVSGNALLFSPPAFTALATPGSPYDDAGSQLQFELIGNTAGDFIDKITIKEFGDGLFLGPDDATGAYINMTFFVTVLEVAGSAIAPVTTSVIGTFTVGPVFGASSTPGSVLWQVTAFIDVDAYLVSQSIDISGGGATKVRVGMDNDLVAYVGAGGVQAKVQKKVTNGVVVTVPEPSALAMLALGFLSLGLRARRSE